jgi:hypothetical protein
MSARPARLLFVGCHVLCLILCVGASAAAQNRIGVTAGLNWTSLGGDAPEDAQYNRAIGVNVGLVGDIALTKDVTLSFQPMYTRRGTNISFDVGESDPRDSLELRLDYVDCLVMLKVFTNSGRNYFTSGLGIGFLTQATLKDIRAGEQDVGGFFQDVDVSVAFGVGFVVPAGNTLMNFELRYQQSLVNMINTDAIQATEAIAPRLRASGFQLLASVLFPRRG